MMNKLREATAQLHTDIEKDNLAGLIMSHEITMEEYKLLLLQNYVAYITTETALSENLENYVSNKSERLERDLGNLNVNTSIAHDFRDHFSIANRAEALGAAYVVEGSSLGGMMISQEIKNCEALSQIATHYFFNGDRNNVKSWNRFSKTLNNETFTEAEEIQVINKAKETFNFFGYVFNTVRMQNSSN